MNLSKTDRLKTKMLRISSSNPKVNGKSVVRVYLNDVLIAEEYVAKRNPVPYLKSLKYSKHLVSLERQLLNHNVTLTDIGLR